MPPNLHPLTTYDNDLPPSDISEDSFMKPESIMQAIPTEAGGIDLPFSDVVFENFMEPSMDLTLHIDKVGRMRRLSRDSDEVDNYDLDSSRGSISSSCSASREPISPNTDPLTDESIDSIESSSLIHPLAHYLDTKNDAHVEASRQKEVVSIASVNPSKTSALQSSYMTLRITYLLVTLVIMLADGLQGTHLYVLYEGYGYSVAYLYCLGFATGGLLSPMTGPLVDKIGRKKSAILYCVLEMFINYLEQFPYLSGLIVCRMIGGFTTNLLSSVFETWLDTEYRRRDFEKEKYEIIMRDSVIISNAAAIFSGYLSHVLANHYGTVGPFKGAVTCTTIALIVVCFVWTENYGVSEGKVSKNMMGYFKEAVTAFREDRKMLTVGLLQSLTTGAIQIFVFLWAPTLRQLAQGAPAGTWGLDQHGEPAYGLIFGAFMGAGVLGGLVAPKIRTFVTKILSPIVDEDAPIATIEVEGEGNVPIRPMAVEFLASSCYFVSALLLFVPSMCQDGHASSFSSALLALLLYEFLIGIFMPCEGVIRSLYFPTDARASIMTLPRMLVNIAVAVGVVSTNFISLKTAFFAVGCLMTISSILQISLISHREWSSLFSRVDRIQDQVAVKARRLSNSLHDALTSPQSSFRFKRLHRLSSDVTSDDGSDLFDVVDTYQLDVTLWEAVASKCKEE